MNVLESLKEVRETSKKENFNILDSAQKLLTADSGKERMILKDLSLDHNLVQIEKLQEEEIEIQKIEKTGNTFKRAEIEKLAVQYGLRLLPTKHFKGDIDVELGSKIRRFMDTHYDGYDSWSASTKFFILAPIEAFELEHVPKPKPIPKISEDPILFYQPNPNKDYFVVVHKWGTDFTPFRRIKGFLTATPLNMVLAQILYSILIAGAILGGTILFTGAMTMLAFVMGFLIVSAVTLAALVCCTDYSYHNNAKLWDKEQHNIR